MPNTQLYYRLRVRAADDLSDALVITSVPGGTNPYLVKAFSGDGRSFAPLDGTVETGSYTVEVIDVLTAANTRVVTAALADVNARQQLLSRKAYGETSNNGSAWTPLFGGYVTAVRLVSPLKFEFAIGETRRISADSDVFKSTVLTRAFDGTPLTFSQFDKTTCIFGGPIRGGWLWVRDLGGWRFKVTQVRSSPPYVQMKLLRGFDPRKPEMGTFSTLSDAIVNYMCGVAAPYYRESPTWKAATIRGYFPGILYRVQSTVGALIGNFTPLSEPVHPDKATPPNIFTRTGEASIWVAWTGTQPTVGDQYDVYMYPTDISEDNPLHVFEHPVDLLQKLRDERAIAYDSSVLAAVRSAIGDDLRLALRITKSPGKLKDLEQTINGLFGIATRSNGAGAEVQFAHRIKLSSSPGSTITVNDLRDAGGTPFDLDEQTVTNKVTIKQKRLTQRIPGADEPNADSIIPVDQAITVNNSDGDTTAYGDKETIYEIEGQILTQNAQQEFDLEKYTLGVAREIFDRWGRGAIGGDLHCLPSVTVDVGQEVLVNIPQLPNAVIGASPVSQRGGNRIVQVTRRTETPSGPDLYVIDSGTTAQPGTVPTFNITVNADDPYHFVDLEVSNGAALAAAGYNVRIEIATGTGAPSAGTLLTILDLAKIPLSIASLTVAQAAALTVAQAAAYSSSLPGVRVPAHDAGTKIWARMRSERDGYRPSSWTSFAGVTLTALNAVTGLAVSAEDPLDPSTRTLTWTIGANAADYPVEVLIRLTSESSAADRIVAILPKGSNRYDLTELDLANRTATVRHRETAPFNGVSSDSTIAVNTTLGAVTLAAPTNPVAFSTKIKGDGVLLAPGTFGIDVNAAVFPCGVEIAVKVGGGAYETREIVPALPFGATRWMAIAPNDGQTRFLKARHVLPGYVSSAYCAEVSVIPWFPTAFRSHFFSTDGLHVLFDGNTQQVTSDSALAQGVFQVSAGTSRSIAKGYQAGFVKDAGAVTFNPVYQNLPQIKLSGGKAANATFPYDDFAAQLASASGFTCKARNKSKGTITARTAEFTAPLTTSVAGATVGPATLASAPSYDNNYTARFGISVTITIPSGGGHTDVVVAVESNDGVSGWIERATRAYSALKTGAGTNTVNFTLQEVPIADSSLGASDQIRLKLKSITVTGPGGSTGGATLTGYDNTGGFGHGVTYSTSSGFSDESKTPDADDYILWEAYEVSA